MADVHNKQQRSYNMSRIKGKDTKPEMLVNNCCSTYKSMLVIVYFTNFKKLYCIGPTK